MTGEVIRTLEDWLSQRDAEGFGPVGAPPRHLRRRPDWAAIRARRAIGQAEVDAKRYARNAVRCALDRGELERGPCALEDSTCKGPIDGHHESYEPEHWLEVTWLCRSHHARVDYVPKRRAS